MSSSQHLALDKIYQGDCLEILPTLPAQSVDMIFADPPYNLQLEKELFRPNLTPVSAVDDEWDRFNSFEDYDTFTRDWLASVDTCVDLFSAYNKHRTYVFKQLSI